MSNNMISVVVPLYNKEKFVKRTVDSVLAQTYTNFELIIIDDGSTDNSLEVVNNIRDNRIKVYSYENRGVSHARNQGIEVANYDYIAFIDADDIWDKCFLDRINDLINKYPKAGAYGTGYKFKYDNGKESIPESIRKYNLENSGILSDYFQYALVSPILTASSIVIPKDVFNKIGVFHTNFNRGEDLEMWARIALEYDIAFDSEILVTYFLEASDRSVTSPLNVKKSFAFIAKDYYKKNANKPNASMHFRNYMLKQNLLNAYNHNYVNDRRNALKILWPPNRYYFTQKLFWKTIIQVLINYHKKS